MRIFYQQKIDRDIRKFYKDKDRNQRQTNKNVIEMKSYMLICLT